MEGRAIGRIVSFISLFVDGKYKTSNTGEKSKAVPMSLKSGKVMPPLFLPADIFYLICAKSTRQILHDVSASFRIYYPPSIYLLFLKFPPSQVHFSGWRIKSFDWAAALSLCVCVCLSLNIYLELVVGGSCLATLDKQELIDWHPAAAAAEAADPSFAH